MPQPDDKKEIAKQVEDAKKIAEFVRSEGWQRARRKLYDKILQLDSLNRLPEGLSDEQKLREVGTRAGTVSILLEWLKEVEGDAEQAQATIESLKPAQEEEIVSRFA